MIQKENRLSSLALLGITGGIIMLFLAIAIIFERYMKSSESKIFYRLVLFTFLIEISLMLFLIFSFSRIKFIPGPQGPKGIRGRPGLQGKYDSVEKCIKQTKNLGKTYLEKKEANTIIIQKPVLGTGGHPPNEEYYN